MKNLVDLADMCLTMAIKMVSGLISNDYHERLAELGMETLEKRRHRIDN